MESHLSYEKHSDQVDQLLQMARRTLENSLRKKGDARQILLRHGAAQLNEQLYDEFDEAPIVTVETPRLYRPVVEIRPGESRLSERRIEPDHPAFDTVRIQGRLACFGVMADEPPAELRAYIRRDNDGGSLQTHTGPHTPLWSANVAQARITSCQKESASLRETLVVHALHSESVGAGIAVQAFDEMETALRSDERTPAQTLRTVAHKLGIELRQEHASSREEDIMTDLLSLYMGSDIPQTIATTQFSTTKGAIASYQRHQGGEVVFRNVLPRFEVVGASDRRELALVFYAGNDPIQVPARAIVSIKDA